MLKCLAAEQQTLQTNYRRIGDMAANVYKLGLLHEVTSTTKIEVRKIMTLVNIRGKNFGKSSYERISFSNRHYWFSQFDGSYAMGISPLTAVKLLNFSRNF